MAKLHLIVGPWGSGKSELVKELRVRQPGAVVLDWDLILPALSELCGTDIHSDPSTWPGLTRTWRDLVAGILASGVDVVLVGPKRSSDISIEGVPVGEAYLDCSDETLRARLKSRAEDAAAVEDELRMAARLRASGLRRIDADRPVGHVADDVERWLRSEF